MLDEIRVRADPAALKVRDELMGGTSSSYVSAWCVLAEIRVQASPAYASLRETVKAERSLSYVPADVVQREAAGRANREVMEARSDLLRVKPASELFVGIKTAFAEAAVRRDYKGRLKQRLEAQRPNLSARQLREAEKVHASPELCRLMLQMTPDLRGNTPSYSTVINKHKHLTAIKWAERLSLPITQASTTDLHVHTAEALMSRLGLKFHKCTSRLDPTKYAKLHWMATKLKGAVGKAGDELAEYVKDENQKFSTYEWNHQGHSPGIRANGSRAQLVKSPAQCKRPFVPRLGERFGDWEKAYYRPGVCPIFIHVGSNDVSLAPTFKWGLSPSDIAFRLPEKIIERDVERFADTGVILAIAGGGDHDDGNGGDGGGGGGGGGGAAAPPPSPPPPPPPTAAPQAPAGDQAPPASTPALGTVSATAAAAAAAAAAANAGVRASDAAAGAGASAVAAAAAGAKRNFSNIKRVSNPKRVEKRKPLENLAGKDKKR